MIQTINYTRAVTNTDYETGKKLFQEYADSLQVDLCFQDFANELSNIHLQYNQPSGALLIASVNNETAGCAGIRKIDNETAELKRMYVRNQFRGFGIGAKLLEQCLAIASELGYKKIRLDTLKEMQKAQALYRSFGFHEIPSYRPNPHEGTVYMQKEL